MEDMIRVQSTDREREVIAAPFLSRLDPQVGFAIRGINANSDRFPRMAKPDCGWHPSTLRFRHDFCRVFQSCLGDSGRSAAD